MSDRQKGCKLLVPNGSLQKVIHQLLADAGIPISYPDDRSYRGLIDNERLFPPPFNVATLMRPWDMPRVVVDRKAELAITGEDLVWEADCEKDVVILERFPLSRTGRGFTQLVVAVPNSSPITQVSDLRPEHEIWTEYPDYARRWFSSQGVNPTIRRCHGSLEAFSEIADGIFENSEWGRSLRVGGWQIIAEVGGKCQPCLITYPEALKDRKQKQIIKEVRLLLRAVMAARSLCLVKCNVSVKRYDAVLKVMTSYGADGTPTVSKLAGGGGFALELVVKTNQVKSLLPRLSAAGGKRISQIPIDKFVP